MPGQRKPRAGKSASPSGNGSKPAEEEQPQVIDAILIVKQQNADGIGIDIQTLGNVQITEVQTLLELGLRTFREKIGLSSQK